MITKPEPGRGALAAILVGAAVMLALSTGMRQSMGLLQPAVLRELPLTAADYSFAIALQNLVWGLTQPIFGALVDRHGARRVAAGGALCYGLGLMVARYSSSVLPFTIGLGVITGIAMSCTGSTIAMAITSRAVSPARRSLAMGVVSAAGSGGLLFVSPLAQQLMASGGWSLAFVGFAGLAAVMLPAAMFAGGVDGRAAAETGSAQKQSAADAIREAAAHPGYVVMALAYFVCGLQLVFLTTHLPNYLDVCGLAPSVAASTLALIGLFNALGSLAFGWLGGRYSKRLLLGGIYMARAIIVTLYFTTPPTPATTLLFGAVMGSLWLGVIPLVNGLVIDIFGIRYMATLVGVAFFSHQLGSFVGAWGGGLVFSWLGSYEWAWRFTAGISFVAGIAQMRMNLRPIARSAGPTALHVGGNSSDHLGSMGNTR
ncbi:MAG: MFS transporter [Burkholderiaceae bacterium]|nr:MFS transporter [Burkholderiaceae bacterium]